MLPTAYDPLRRWLPGISVGIVLGLLLFPPARAQAEGEPIGMLACLQTGLPLVKIPEIVSSQGVLRGTILLIDQQQRLAFRHPPPDDARDAWFGLSV